MDLVFKDLHATFDGHSQISETDRYPLEGRLEELEALKKAGQLF